MNNHFYQLISLLPDLDKTRSPADVLSQPEGEVLHQDNLLGSTGVGVGDQGVVVLLAINSSINSISSTSIVVIKDREGTRASEVEVEGAEEVSNQEDLNQARRRL